jgi:hypothetical protein
MQKKLKSLLIVASFVVAATLVFIACGDGQVIEITQGMMQDSEGHAKEKYSSVLFEYPYNPSQSSEAEPPPVSFNPSESSSSAYVPPPNSSTSPITPGSSSGGSPAVSSSSATVPRSSSSAVVQPPAAGCRESSPKSGFTCGWNGYTATGTLTPGTTLKPATYTLPSGCSSVEWKYAPDTAAMALNYECKKTEESGFAALGSKTYVLFADLTCDDGTHTNACNPTKGWSSKLAPELTGVCVWSKTPTTTARGAVPSGVSVIDTDRICTSPTVVYKYDGGTKTWPKDGGPLTEAKTYSDVEATLNCPAYSQPVTVACPALEVKAGADHQIVCSGGIDAANCGNKNKINVQNDECIDVEIAWSNSHDNPSIKMRCTGQFQQTSGTAPTTSISIKVGSASTVTANGSNYTENSVTIIPSIPVGTKEVLGICISYTSTQTLPSNISCELAR